MRKKIISALLCLALACAPVTALAGEETETEFEFEEIAIFDSDEYVAKITSIEPDDDYGYTLKTYFENNSETDCFFTVTDSSVNGIVSYAYFGETVVAGKKSNNEFAFYSLASIEEDIGDITSIEITFAIYGNDTWDELANETIYIYPAGEKNAAAFERKLLDTDIVLLDNEEISFIMIGSESDGYSYNANFFVQNKTETDLSISASNVSVNGYMLDPYWGVDLPAGKCIYSAAAWYNDNLEENGIDEVENIEFTLLGYDESTWEECINESIMIEP